MEQGHSNFPATDLPAHARLWLAQWPKALPLLEFQPDTPFVK